MFVTNIYQFPLIARGVRTNLFFSFVLSNKTKSFIIIDIFHYKVLLFVGLDLCCWKWVFDYYFLQHN